MAACGGQLLHREARGDIDGRVPHRPGNCTAYAWTGELGRDRFRGAEGSWPSGKSGQLGDNHTEKGDRGSGRWVTGLWCSRGAEARHLIEVQSKRRVCMGHRSDTRIVT